MSPQYLFKIVTVGSAAVGKTSIIVRYMTGRFRDYYAPTLGTDFAIKDIRVDDRGVKLQIWDMGSQDFLGKVREKYYQGARGVIYMYDMTRRDTFDQLWQWKKEVDAQTRGPNTIIVANKADLVNERQVTKEEGEDLARRFFAEHREVSVKLNQGVDETFLQMGRQILAATK